ncbi:TPA: hypothetical protein HH295_15950 [Xanthomonas vasicola pv. zeae]|uniref:Uncharacterized protein n=2 Tax=Xanthomonas vasicola pv. vasculorum TaxID=325776 RepID=A0A836ZTL9_XANVA|nr:hypothetical protein [Xanthomonas vasicola]KFA33080.1 hypothetical protein KWS_0113010 [Xanthomonas vasicola pv. musacearum NCPPB 4384]AVQ07779.1 hypothetical protein C7V42_15360 [Xanthomonas vasicola pv. vasculorum]AZM71977.1 hypothetical protein CXP37_15375 [Xanthomonas vasicola pv. vasculorum]AZR26594.1 hypothetical protein NX80_008935 [Xanthomonas vasicola pv. arecae]AZR30315.1 hypothetical protein KWO_006950 [Xanthomonas vasicola pv. musacearum NCPPB 4379]
MHKAVDKCAQAPARNAVKIGGEKMTNHWRRIFFACGCSDLDRIGKVVGTSSLRNLCAFARCQNDVVRMQTASGVPTAHAVHFSGVV